MGQQVADDLVAKISDGVAGLGGALLAICGWLVDHINNVAIFVGIFCTIVPVIVGWHFKRRKDQRDAHYRMKEDQRKQEMHEAQLAALERTNRLNISST